MKKVFFILIFSGISCMAILSQTNFEEREIFGTPTQLNRHDAEGLRHGTWVRVNNRILDRIFGSTNYLHGKNRGIEAAYECLDSATAPYVESVGCSFPALSPEPCYVVNFDVIFNDWLPVYTFTLGGP